MSTDLPNPKEVEILFNALKINQKSDKIEKSLLISLLLYTEADKVDPLFYSYIKKKLDSKQELISLEEFQKIFDTSQSRFTRLNAEEMTHYFELFDPNRKGAITADDFINAYRTTADFKNLKGSTSEEQIIKDLEKDFQIISENKQISPQEFFNMITDSTL